MQEVKEAGTPGKSTNYQWARREAAEELRKQEEEELSEQTRSGEMGGEEGRKEEKIEKEETKEKETKRRSLKTTTPKKKSERVTRGNASGFWSLTVLPGGQGFLGRLGAPRDLFKFRVRGCSRGFLRGSFGRA